MRFTLTFFQKPHQYFYSKVSIPFFCILLCLSSPSFVSATEQPEIKKWLQQTTKMIKKQENLLKRAIHKNKQIKNSSETVEHLIQVKAQSQECIVNTNVQLLKLTKDLETLGEPGVKEAREVIKKRRSLTKNKKHLDSQISICKLVLLQSQDLIKSINKIQQEILAQQLTTRTPDIITIFAENINAPVEAWKNAVHFFHTQLKLFNYKQVYLFIFLMFIALVCGFFLGRLMLARACLADKPKESVSAFILSIKTCLAKSLYILFPAGVAAVFFSIALPLTPLPFITKMSYLLGCYLCLIILINILYKPAAPAQFYLTKTESLSIRFARQLKFLSTIGLIGFLSLTGEFKDSLNEPLYYLTRGTLSVFLSINLIAILWTLRLFSWVVLSRSLRFFLSSVLIASLIAELSGYRNLSAFVLGGLVATSISLGLTLLLYKLLKDLYDGLDENRLEWAKKLRIRIGLKKNEAVPGLIWLRIISYAGLWGGFGFLALKIWKLDDPWLAIIISYFTEGFHIGSLNVIPTQLLGGILAFAIILSITRYIKTHILPNMLKHTKLDRGAREAVTSLVGYAGVTVAILISLSITGVKMQNIAIIAGALSVGIGFGLQNIANNFISGLILLFERPVRRGDWIVTGEIEGHVKAINLRSTLIQTFDRADVIVPNSELITAKVTNWMLGDSYGRVSIPIGVGYGSDVEKVHQILLDIACRHPMVVKEHPQLKEPEVLFRDFGDSALNFELRCFIRDIDQRIRVISEFNFTIFAAFKREGIEIPFPQQVITYANKKDQGKNESN